MGDASRSPSHATRILRIIAAAVLFLLGAGEPNAGDPCASCHASAAETARHRELARAHPPPAFGCVRCHHGNASARDRETAHAGSGPDELLTPGTIAASCAECHVPGSVAGTELLVLGAKTYLELGCPLCHKGLSGFGYPAAFAPALSTIGIRGSAYLRTMLHDPASIFKATVMPSFDGTLRAEPEKERALLAYLLSLRGDVARPMHHASAPACATCHASIGPAKSELYSRHACALIHDERESLRCARCHPKSVPKSDSECLYISQRRRDCGVCHSGGVDGQ